MVRRAVEREAGSPEVPLAADGSPHGDRRTRRDWVGDSAVFAVATLVSVLTFVVAAAPEGSGFRRPPVFPLWLDLTVGGATLLSLWWRRRYPVTLAIASVLGGLVSTVAGGAAMVMLLTVAIHRRWPWAVLVGAVNVLLSVLFFVLWSDGSLDWFEWLVISGFGVAFTAALIGFGMFVRARRQLLATLRERAERAEAEQRRASEAARQGERTRIAREMHDVLAHRISLVSMHAGALEYREDATAEEVATAAGVIRQNAHQALVDLREVIGVLRQDEETGRADGTSTSRPQPTLDALESLLAETRAAGVTVRAEVDVADAPLALTTSRTAYRVLQEGLTNARKHGRGAAVDVCVRGVPGDGLSLEVRNSLRPASLVPSSAGSTTARSEVPGSGVGLVGLAERTRLAGGRWEHGVVDDAFRLHVWLPWPGEDEG